MKQAKHAPNYKQMLYFRPIIYIITNSKHSNGSKLEASYYYIQEHSNGSKLEASYYLFWTWTLLHPRLLKIVMYFKCNHSSSDITTNSHHWMSVITNALTYIHGKQNTLYNFPYQVCPIASSLKISFKWCQNLVFCQMRYTFGGKRVNAYVTQDVTMNCPLRVTCSYETG